MPKDAILTIINLIQNSGSAVKESDLYALLPREMSRKDFGTRLAELEKTGDLYRDNNLVLKDKESVHERNRSISRKIFSENSKYLKLFARLPWVRYMSLTGSNAFESCYKDDDIDLFVICAADRLWLVYIMIVVLSKLFGKRPFFCFNFLIDENNMAFGQQSYHNAVQIFMMKPLFNAAYKRALYEKNPWIKDFLPNISLSFEVDDFYRLRHDFTGRKTFSSWFTKMNNSLYEKYKYRLTQKYPHAINKGIILGKGYAKLHQNDKSHMYDDMMAYNVKIDS
jgi:hypothetical protein